MTFAFPIREVLTGKESLFFFPGPYFYNEVKRIMASNIKLLWLTWKTCWPDQMKTYEKI